MLKVLFAILVTIFCIALGLIPEVVMYTVYSLISPESELTRVLVLLAFWLTGFGVCVGFAILAFMLWTLMITEVLK